MRLIEIPEGKKVTVKEIKGGRGIKNRLAAVGIYPGAEVKVIKTPPGPMIVEVEGARFALGRGMASRIEVEER